MAPPTSDRARRDDLVGDRLDVPGPPVIYCDYLGYDEVGHFAGPETRDAVGTLTGIDRQIRQIPQAAREAPRRYQLVVLSDHGQTTSPVFEAVYGKPLDEMVREVINAGPDGTSLGREGRVDALRRRLPERARQEPAGCAVAARGGC